MRTSAITQNLRSQTLKSHLKAKNILEQKFENDKEKKLK